MNGTSSCKILPRAAAVFALGLALCLMLHAVFQYWRWHGLPSFALTLGALPWSLPWLKWWRPLSQPLGTDIRLALDAFFLSFGAAMNGTLIYVIVSLWRCRRA
jgi:hypothetical protein